MAAGASRSGETTSHRVRYFGGLEQAMDWLMQDGQ